jgi:hypothetical protein
LNGSGAEGNRFKPAVMNAMTVKLARFRLKDLKGRQKRTEGHSYITDLGQKGIQASVWNCYRERTAGGQDCLQTHFRSTGNKRVRFEVITAATMKNVVFWDIKTQFLPHRRNITSLLQSPAG